jgi:uncharacterized protein (TIGR03435 family)
LSRHALRQRLLEERFGLRMRREPRDRPAYALLLNRTDGRLGPQLTPAEAKDCSDLTLAEARARRCGSGVYFDKEAQLTVAYGSDEDLTALVEHLRRWKRAISFGDTRVRARCGTEVRRG